MTPETCCELHAWTAANKQARDTYRERPFERQDDNVAARRADEVPGPARKPAASTIRVRRHRARKKAQR